MELKLRRWERGQCLTGADILGWQRRGSMMKLVFKSWKTAAGYCHFLAEGALLEWCAGNHTQTRRSQGGAGLQSRNAVSRVLGHKARCRRWAWTLVIIIYWHRECLRFFNRIIKSSLSKIERRENTEWIRKIKWGQRWDYYSDCETWVNFRQHQGRCCALFC